METGYITTPFGRRPMTLALVKRQVQVEQAKPETVVDKWRVFHDVGHARVRLGLQDRALAVLNALLSFFPAPELSAEKNLIVFPSNAQLSARANGIAGTTLRKNLAALVDAGIVIRKDSPNGKRYARKGDEGAIEDAYGFSLAPLLARASEFAALAQDVAAEQRRFRLMKDRLTIVRRDVRKLISVGMEENLPGDWQAAEGRFVDIVAKFVRRPTLDDLVASLDEMTLLHEEVSRMLETQQETKNSDGNDIVFGCHIQNSNTESYNELEPSFERKQAAKAERRPPDISSIHGLEGVPRDREFRAGRFNWKLARVDECGRNGALDARGEPVGLRGGLRDYGTGNRSNSNCLHLRAGGAYQFGRRLSSGSHGESAARRVFTRANGFRIVKSERFGIQSFRMKCEATISV
jgi:hypothetical protein